MNSSNYGRPGSRTSQVSHHHISDSHNKHSSSVASLFTAGGDSPFSNQNLAARDEHCAPKTGRIRLTRTLEGLSRSTTKFEAGPGTRTVVVVPDVELMSTNYPEARIRAVLQEIQLTQWQKN